MAKTVEQILDSLFGENESLTKAQLVAEVANKGFKLVDLTDGDFVTKQKFDDHKIKYDKLKSDFDALKSSTEPDKEALAQITRERDEYKSKFEDFSSKVTRQERLEVLDTHKVDKKFRDFVLSEVSKNVTDVIDFGTACTKYLKDNPQYISEEKPASSSSSGMLFGDKTNPTGGQGLFDDLNNFIRGEK